MRYRRIFSKTTLFLAICLALGCSKKSEAPELAETTEVAAVETETVVKPTLESKLLGVYKVTKYEGNENACEPLTAVPQAPPYVVLYSFVPNSKPDEARLGGAFCGDPNLCRAMGQNGVEPTVGYSFISGDDEAGWQGWAIAGGSPVEDERCQADVQSHRLTPLPDGAIRVETKTIKPTFAPRSKAEGICYHKDAIAAVTADLPCEALLVLEASFETGL